MGIYAKYLSIYGLVVTRRGREGYKYKLTEYGYNISEYVIKNSVISYRHLEEKV